MPWILDVGYTVLLVALLVAFMGHLLFGDFEVTMNTVSSSVTGLHPMASVLLYCTAVQCQNFCQAAQRRVIAGVVA